MDTHREIWTWSCVGDDLDWLSQKLNEKLELVRLPCWNGSVIHSDSGLTWEADPRHAELAVAGLGLQAARPQKSLGGAKPSTPLDHKELELDG